MILYDHPLSSYAQKVKIALREKASPLSALSRMISGLDGRIPLSPPRTRAPRCPCCYSTMGSQFSSRP